MEAWFTDHVCMSLSYDVSLYVVSCVYSYAHNVSVNPVSTHKPSTIGCVLSLQE